MSETTVVRAADNKSDGSGFTIQPATLGINRLTHDQLEAFFLQYAEYAKAFRITLVKENGQEYNAVVHNGGSDPKVRLALLASDGKTVDSSWLVRDMIERLFANGQFDSNIEATVNHGLMGLDGSVMIKVDQIDPSGEIVKYGPDSSGALVPLTTPAGYTVTKAVWHEDNIWP